LDKGNVIKKNSKYKRDNNIKNNSISPTEIEILNDVNSIESED